MNRFMVIAASLAATAALGSSVSAQDYVKGRLLVKFKESATESQKIHTIGLAKGKIKLDSSEYGLTVLELPENANINAQMNILRKRSDVEFVEPDYIYEPDMTPNDPQFGSQWHHQRILSANAWDRTQGSPNVTIAILDSGVAGFHADLANQMVPGWNMYSNNSDTNDVYGHGTKVAGAAAAATNNLTGVSGVGFNCKIMPIRVTSTTGSASASALANGLRWAADRGARVANLSFNAASSSAVIDAANYFASKGGVVTMSAGNNATFNSQGDIANILTVSATHSGDGLSGFSNTGNLIDCAAPGEGIATTTMDGGYAGVSGTSFSAPVTAGVAALMFSANPSLSSQQCMDMLRKSGDDLGSPGWDASFGYGRVNAQRAVETALGSVGVDRNAPSVSFAAPSNGSTVGGTVSVFVNASDDNTVDRVEFYINNQIMGAKTSAPYSWSWNSTNVSDGSYGFKAVAYDAAGNSAQSTINVTVKNAVQDTTPPSVGFTAPSNGATVAGTVGVSVSASDNVGVSRVDFYMGSQFMGSRNAAPYSLSWNTTASVDGNYTWKAVAYDAAGNSAESTVGVTVLNNPADTTPPSVGFTSPANNATVSGNVSVSASASDNVGVAKVEFYVNNQLVASSTSAPYSFNWATSNGADGLYNLRAVAYDQAGNTSQSTINVTVKNAQDSDTEAPSVQITSPRDGDKAGNRLSVTVDATDNVKVVRVELYVDGELVGVDTGGPFAWNLNTRKWAKGSHVLQARGYDAAVNVGFSQTVTVLH